MTTGPRGTPAPGASDAAAPDAAPPVVDPTVTPTDPDMNRSAVVDQPGPPATAERATAATADGAGEAASDPSAPMPPVSDEDRDREPRASVAPPPDRPVTEAAPAAASMSPADEIVFMADVSRRFGDRVVVREINLTVPRGTILGIIGPSGAGKTTTIRMLTGGLQPTTGDVRVLGRAPKKFRRSERERIGYMPQLFTLYEDLTAGENVDFVASLFGMLFRRRRRRVREVLKVVDLWDARGRVASKLSGGMQRRLELACALVHEPELIILDEPTAGIDPLLRGTIWEELHRLRDAGRTLLVTTQHVAEAEECDAVALIVGGEIIALAPPDELRRSATNGDLLDVQTATVFDASDLVGQPGVKEVTQDSPRHFRITVDDAGTALPQIVERIRSKGVDVESAQENRLSFDEIFAILVARHGDATPTAPEDRPTPSDHRGRAAA